MDTSRRSWIKSITWRIIGIVILGAISYKLTHDLKAMTGITLIFNAIRLILYYVHERIWERIHWGKIRHPLEHLPVKTNLTPGDYDLIRDYLNQQKYLQPEYQI
jgi:uncharacterized membrane protein